MARDRAITILRQPGLNLGYLAFNVTRKPFDDLRVRQAINLAIDRRAILDAVFQGSALPAKNPLAPGMWSYNGEVEDYPYDPKRARALLAEAGLADGFATDLWAMPVPRAYVPNPRLVAGLIQADLAKVNIHARIVTAEWTEYRRRVQDGEHQMALYGGFADNGDPDDVLTTLLGCAAARTGGGNVSKWCNQEFEALISDARRTSDVAIRTRLYQQAQLVVKREAPWVTIAHALVFDAVRKEVEGYVMSPLNRHDFRNVSIRPARVVE